MIYAIKLYSPIFINYIIVEQKYIKMIYLPTMIIHKAISNKIKIDTNIKHRTKALQSNTITHNTQTKKITALIG